MKRLVLLLAAAALSACNLSVDQPGVEANNPSDPATETFAPNLKIDLSKMTKRPSGVYVQDIKVGDGTAVSGSPSVMFTYAGFLKTGDLFGSDRLTAPIPMSQLIAGMQDGLQGMQVGGERVMVIPSALGYQNVARPGIPANSTLVFDIILDAIP